MCPLTTPVAIATIQMLQNFALQPMEILKRYNSVPIRDNCTLFAPTPYFWAQAIRWCHLNFFPANPRCHGNEFWDKIDYNLAPVKDNCTLFAPTPLFSGPSYPLVSFKFLPWRPLLPWQLTILIQRQNWLHQTLLHHT